jgi:putative ATP-dependent endonuclease of OLD family
MRISKVSIENFRNFSNIEVNTGRNLLLVGSNASGKSNFIHALRLVLDSSLSRKERKLTADDFWRGNGLLPWRGRQIKISVELTDFENNKNLRSYLDDCNPGKTGFATITYIFRPKGNVDPSQAKESDYEMRRYGGNDVDNEVPPQLFDYLNLRVIDALRNAESELVARRVPLKSLLELYSIDSDALKGVATYLEATNKHIESIAAIQILESDIKGRLDNLKEQVHELDPVLRLGVTTSEDVLSALRILLEKDLLLPLHTTSLGLANLLYLALSLLEIEKRESIAKPVSENEYEFIILAIEEPEAHIHPHVQRLLFRDFLKRSPFILSTHSPHIASVAPLDSILMLRKPDTTTGCVMYSTAKLYSELETSEIEDLQRYLDVTRAELLFARGVIFVEGDAEEFVIPVFAKLIGIDLDKYGISVCNVRSTNFRPLIKLVGIDGINIPFVVINTIAKMREKRSFRVR